MSAVILFAGNPDNQFNMSAHDLDFNSRNYKFNRLPSTEIEQCFSFVNSIGVRHIIIVQGQHIESLQTIAGNQRLLRSDPRS